MESWETRSNSGLSPVSISSNETPQTESRYYAKKPHRKSRAGCILCKRRKVKCDEQHPQCTPCKKRDIRCSFTSAGREYQSQLSNALIPACSLNSIDLHLMHHFATTASAALSECRPEQLNLLRNEIPRLAFQHDYLMHCLLSISSLHIDYLAPKNPLHNPKAIVLHRINALSGFRNAITDLSPRNSEAVLVTSVFLLILGSMDCALQGDGISWVTNWFGLHAGLRAIIDQVSWPFVQKSSVGPVFYRGIEPIIIPAKLPLNLWEMATRWEATDEQTQTLSIALHALGSLYSILLAEGTSRELFLKVCSWPASLPAEFAAAAKTLRPEALIILAYYLAFSKLAGVGWWLDGISDRGIPAISSVLDSQWHQLMKMPLRIVQVTDKVEISMLLLSELPGDGIHDLSEKGLYGSPRDSPSVDVAFGYPRHEP